MTDPITASVMIILGKYALDKGAELAKEAGPAAAKKAGELFKAALARLRRDPAGEIVAQEYEQDPPTYEKPVEKKLEAAVQADPAFAAQLQALLADYEAAAQAHAVAAGTTYRATVKGSGAAAQGAGATALGKGAVQAGNVTGSIITGSQRDVKDKADD